MKQTPIQQRRLLIMTLIAMLVFAACRPDDSLDITPSPTQTPEPSATPSPTPLPADFVDPGLANQRVLDALLELLPKSIPAGDEQWNLDYSRGEDGLDDILGIRGTAAGKQIYFRTQEAGQMSFYFVVFDTAEEALANYNRILGIRSVLETGDSKEDFPQPNIFGAGLYGSVSHLPDRQLLHRSEYSSCSRGAARWRRCHAGRCASSRITAAHLRRAATAQATESG